MIKKRLAVILFFAMLFTPASRAKAEQFSDKDALVGKYINQMVPDGAVEIKSDFTTDFLQITDTTTSDISDMVKTEVHTYKVPVHDDIAYHTVIVLEVSDEIVISKNDEVQVFQNDYLFPIDPIDARLLTKNSRADHWNATKKVIAQGQLDGITIVGSELQNRSKFTMVFLSFPSLENVQAKSTFPEYKITFTNHKQATSFSWIYILAAVLMLAVIIWRKKHKG